MVWHHSLSASPMVTEFPFSELITQLRVLVEKLKQSTEENEIKALLSDIRVLLDKADAKIVERLMRNSGT
jgi:hypothetical protein